MFAAFDIPLSWGELFKRTARETNEDDGFGLARPSNTTCVRISRFNSSRSGLRYSGHSVTMTRASAPSTVP